MLTLEKNLHSDDEPFVLFVLKTHLVCHLEFDNSKCHTVSVHNKCK